MSDKKVCEDCGKCPTCGHRPLAAYVHQQSVTTSPVQTSGNYVTYTTAQEPDCNCCRKDTKLTQAE